MTPLNPLLGKTPPVGRSHSPLPPEPPKPSRSDSPAFVERIEQTIQKKADSEKEAPKADPAPTEARQEPSAACPANVIPFPGTAMILPFPGQLPEPAIASDPKGRPPEPPADAEVEIDVPWPPRRPATNVEDAARSEGTKDAGGKPQWIGTEETTVLKVDFDGEPAGPASREAAGAGAGPETQLPLGDGRSEKNAASSPGGQAMVEGSQLRGAMQPLRRSPEAGLGGPRGAGMSSSEVPGITAANQRSGMDSTNRSDSGQTFLEGHRKALEELDGISVRISEEEVRLERPDDLSTRSRSATDWQAGRPVGLSDRPAPARLEPDSGAANAAGQVERLSQLVLRETALVRQHAPDSMAVVLRPDAHTELFVHFTAQRNGHVHGTVRCEHGDFQQLSALWPQLQESLAQQKVTLAALQQSSTGVGAGACVFSAQSGSGAAHFGQPQNPADRPEAAEDHSLAERPGSASTASASTRGERGSRPSLATSRPGWETWA